jgi:toxin YhaV
MRTACGPAAPDACKLFKGMLDDGNSPDDWEAMHKQASDSKAVTRLEKASPSKS